MFSYFTDSVLRGPTIGSMLMCLTAALVGTIIFLRKQSLLGEALSHAAYPGVILGVLCASLLTVNNTQEIWIAAFIMAGAFGSAILGLLVIDWLQRVLRVHSDAALCFVLSTFFGIGLTLASQIQFSHSVLYRQIQAYLYGQAATMTDLHIMIYGILSVVIIATVLLLDKELQTITFNRDYAASMGINVIAINTIVFILTVLAIVIGIRSVGVVLMSAMLIAPAAAARQYTNKFHTMLCLAAVIGMISGYFGNYLSVELTYFFTEKYPDSHIALPTGPMIVIVASTICLASLLLAPERGFLIRLMRIALFRYRCMRENVLKTIWRYGPSKDVTLEQIAYFQNASQLYLKIVISRLIHNHWLISTGRNTYRLTSDGQQRAAHIIRLHRLWEVYLADYLGVGAERVHRSAEEMEHIITPDLEKELTLLLEDPKTDPHHQDIPPKDGL